MRIRFSCRSVLVLHNTTTYLPSATANIGAHCLLVVAVRADSGLRLLQKGAIPYFGSRPRSQTVSNRDEN
jgi:hypothetical protein